jgi:Uma2 family endonuclease
MGSARLVHVSEADYLSGEEPPGTRHEYVDGQIFAIAGALKTHGTIAGNIFFALRAQLRDTPCRAWVADMKLNVATWTWWPPVATRTCALIRRRGLSPPQN